MPSKWHYVQGLTSHTTSQIRIFESDLLSIAQTKGILAEFSSEFYIQTFFLAIANLIQVTARALKKFKHYECCT